MAVRAELLTIASDVGNVERTRDSIMNTIIEYILLRRFITARAIGAPIYPSTLNAVLIIISVAQLLELNNITIHIIRLIVN